MELKTEEEALAAAKPRRPAANRDGGRHAMTSPHRANGAR